MKKLSYLLVCSLLIWITSCVSNVDTSSDAQFKANVATTQKYIQTKGLSMQTETSTEGVYYSVNDASSTARAAVTAEIATVSYTFSKLSDGSIVDSAVVMSLPYNVNNTLLDYVISKLKVGSTATFLFAQLTTISEPVRLDISLKSLQNADELTASYIAKNYPTTAFTTTDSGLKFFKTVEKPKQDTAVVAGKTVTVTYTGSFLYPVRKLNSTTSTTYYTAVFDSGSFSYVAGSGNLIKGFEEGVLKMKLGEKALLLMPSSIAYGTAGSKNSSTGYYSIPPSSPLLFEVTVTAIK